MEEILKQGETHFSQGNFDEAEKCFIKLLDKNPKDAEVLNNLGVVSHFRGNFQEAESYLLKALAAKEDYIDALQNLADLYQSAKRWKEAAAQLEKYITIENQEKPEDNDVIPVYLKTPRERTINILFLDFLNKHPNLFSVLRLFLERLH